MNIIARTAGFQNGLGILFQSILIVKLIDEPAFSFRVMTK